MPAFDYEALSAEGHTHRGQLDASSARDVRTQLRQRGWTAVAVQPAAASEHQKLKQNKTLQLTDWLNRLRQPMGRARLNAAELAVLTRALAELNGAGLTIARTLAVLEHEARDAGQRVQATLLADLAERVRGGEAFSTAIRAHPHVFDEVFCAIVQAGERSGSLPVVLERLALEREAAQTLRAKLIGAALYPAIVSAVAVLIVLFLMTYVLPQVAGAFAASRRALPTLTVVMLGLAEFLRQWWPALLGGFSLLFTTAYLALRRPTIRTRWHAALLSLPVLGPMLGGYNAARFASTLGMLTGAGVPMLAALDNAAAAVGNAAMRADLGDVTRLVREGAPLGAALAQKPRWPRLVATFATLGAQTGTAAAMLSRVGAQLAAQLERRALHLAAVVEPLLIVTMGAVVLLIVLAVLMPMIELNRFV